MKWWLLLLWGFVFSTCMFLCSQNVYAGTVSQIIHAHINMANSQTTEYRKRLGAQLQDIHDSMGEVVNRVDKKSKKIINTISAMPVWGSYNNIYGMLRLAPLSDGFGGTVTVVYLFK